MRIEKKYIVEELNQRYADSNLMVVTSYQGLSSDKIDDLRAKVSGVNGKINVISNRLLKIALPESADQAFLASLSGANAVATTDQDIVELSKAIKEFADDNKGFEVYGGLLDLKDKLGSEEIMALASLPSKHVLQAQLVCALQGPIRKLAGLFSAMLGNTVRVIDQIAQQKAGEAPTE